MSLRNYINKNLKENNLEEVIHEYVDKNMLTDEDTDLIEDLGFDFEDFIIEENDVYVEDLLGWIFK